MKFAFIQSKSATGSSTAPSAVFDSTPVQNNLLVAGAHVNAGGGLTMSSAGWTALTSVTGTNISLRIFWKIAGAGESTTVTATGPTGGWDISIAEYQAADTVSTANVENAQSNGSVTALASQSVTPYANAALMVGYGGTKAASVTFSSVQIGGSATGVTTRELPSSANNCGILFDRVVGMPSGTYSAIATASGVANTAGMGIAVFNLLVVGTNNYQFASVADNGNGVMSVTEKIR